MKIVSIDSTDIVNYAMANKVLSRAFDYPSGNAGNLPAFRSMLLGIRIPTFIILYNTYLLDSKIENDLHKLVEVLKAACELNNNISLTLIHRL